MREVGGRWEEVVVEEHDCVGVASLPQYGVALGVVPVRW